MWVVCGRLVEQESSFEQRVVMMRLERQKRSAGRKNVNQVVDEEWVNEAEVVGEDEIQQG